MAEPTTPNEPTDLPTPAQWLRREAELESRVLALEEENKKLREELLAARRKAD